MIPIILNLGLQEFYIQKEGNFLFIEITKSNDINKHLN